MEIIRHGINVEKTKCFCCNRRKCLFRANENEYKYTISNYNEDIYSAPCSEPKCKGIGYETDIEF